jgi:DNA-directed RNA polymerase specialized sigma24 family protein
MSSGGSITNLIAQLREGDEAAAQQLLERFYCRVLGVAKRKLQHNSLGFADEQDVAQSALLAFVRGAKKGQFTKLHDRDDLWNLLVVITSRKAVNLLIKEGRKREKHKDAEDQKPSQEGVDAFGNAIDLDGFIDQAPSPEMELLIDEECKRLLSLLGDAQLRAIAVWKLEGHASADIASMLGCSLRTVERKVRLIRQIWHPEVLS